MRGPAGSMRERFMSDIAAPIQRRRTWRHPRDKDPGFPLCVPAGLWCFRLPKGRVRNHRRRRPQVRHGRGGRPIPRRRGNERGDGSTRHRSFGMAADEVRVSDADLSPRLMAGRPGGAVDEGDPRPGARGQRPGLGGGPAPRGGGLRRAARGVVRARCHPVGPVLRQCGLRWHGDPGGRGRPAHRGCGGLGWRRHPIHRPLRPAVGEPGGRRQDRNPARSGARLGGGGRAGQVCGGCAGGRQGVRRR